tara:strand:- start:256 stop:465 length:210 start_codon:yes stop_codon:yes gene_type:complete
MREGIYKAENRADTIIKKLNELKNILDYSSAFPDYDEWEHELDTAITSMGVVSVMINIQHGEVDELLGK